MLAVVGMVFGVWVMMMIVPSGVKSCVIIVVVVLFGLLSRFEVLVLAAVRISSWLSLGLVGWCVSCALLLSAALS